MAQAYETLTDIAVASILRGHGSLLQAFMSNLFQIGLLLGGFWVMGTVFQGVAPKPIRGDFLTYLMSGIFLYQLHLRTVTDCMAAQRKSLSERYILGAGLASLFMQSVTAALILLAYDLWFGLLTVDDLPGFVGLFLLAWCLGIGIGMGLGGVAALNEGMGQMVSQLYIRGSFFLSGQMFVANAMPPDLIRWFNWFPLFHMTDQARDAAFSNYQARHSSSEYALISTLCVLILGYAICRALSALVPAKSAQQVSNRAQARS